MRVLYSFPDTLGAPGIGTTALMQVRSLAAVGVDVHVIATAAAADLGVASTTTMCVAGRRVRHGLLGRDSAGSLRAYAWHDRATAALLRRRAGFDVVHCWPQATLRTAAAASASGIPVLRQAPSTHTRYAVETVAAVNAALGVTMRTGDVHGHSRALIAREEAEYEAVNLVLCPSEHVARTFTDQGVARERLAVHRFGCDLDRFRPAPARHEPGSPPTFVFVARGEAAKGLHHGLRAWAASGAAQAGARLLLCGQIEPRFRARFADLLTLPGVEELGFVSDIAPVMQAADVLLLPSLNEGSALVTYEAQAAGCAVVVSEATSAPAEDMIHGLVHPTGDEEVLAAHVARLATDSELLARLRANVLADRERLSWRAAAEGLVSAYRTAMTSQRGSARHAVV